MILQATLGGVGRSFGGGEAHERRVRTPEEFERHVRDVAALLGRRLLQTRSVFLAGADVLRRRRIGELEFDGGEATCSGGGEPLGKRQVSEQQAQIGGKSRHEGSLQDGLCDGRLNLPPICAAGKGPLRSSPCRR